MPRRDRLDFTETSRAKALAKDFNCQHGGREVEHQGAAGVNGPADGGAASRSRPRTQVRRSSVHGRGVFATRFIPAGDTVLEYQGEVITWPEALRRHPHDPSQPNHTFYFHIDDGRVIDGRVNGNSARWINHCCDPNCEADETDEGRVFIKALRDILPGEELNYDYGLLIDERYTPKLKKQFACHCGADTCRGTMLAPKHRQSAAARAA